MPRSFVTNLADTPSFAHPISGTTMHFEHPDDRFRDTGINIQVLQPGQPSCKYHAENVQEDFLVLGGECLLLLEGEERPLRAWDLVHCEPGAHHVFVGAGDGPCWILQIGARREGMTLDFPVSELAAKYGASSPTPATDGDDAYVDWPDAYDHVPTPWPPQ